MIKKNLILKRKDNKSIVYDLFYEESNTPKPVIIFCHGYKGYKDWGAWDQVAKRFSDKGFFFIKFNFSHNGGTVENPIDFDDLEAFANNNFTKELDDLEAVINLIKTNKSFNNELDPSNISLVAHSRGAGIILIKASEDNRVKRVITWAGVSDFKSRFQIGTDHFNDWKEKGVAFIENSRTKQQMPHYFQFFEDFIDHENRFTIKLAVKKLKIPMLIIQGAADSTVFEKEARLLHQWNPNSELKIIDSADHSFGTKHPWNDKNLPTDLQKVVENTIDFLNELAL